MLITNTTCFTSSYSQQYTVDHLHKALSLKTWICTRMLIYTFFLCLRFACGMNRESHIKIHKNNPDYIKFSSLLKHQLKANSYDYLQTLKSENSSSQHWQEVRHMSLYTATHVEISSTEALPLPILTPTIILPLLFLK